MNQIAGVNIMQNEIVNITDANSLAGATAESKQLALFNAGLSSSYWPMQNLLEINWFYRKLKLSLAADQFEKSDLRSVWFSLSYGQ